MHGKMGDPQVPAVLLVRNTAAKQVWKGTVGKDGCNQPPLVCPMLVPRAVQEGCQGGHREHRVHLPSPYLCFLPFLHPSFQHAFLFFQLSFLSLPLWFHMILFLSISPSFPFVFSPQFYFLTLFPCHGTTITLP